MFDKANHPALVVTFQELTLCVEHAFQLVSIPCLILFDHDRRIEDENRVVEQAQSRLTNRYERWRLAIGCLCSRCNAIV